MNKLEKLKKLQELRNPSIVSQENLAVTIAKIRELSGESPKDRQNRKHKMLQESLDPSLLVYNAITSGEKASEIVSILKGEKGDNGKDGYIPVKGFDYFTSKDVEDFVVKIQSKVVNGKDGRDGKNGYTPINGVDYFTDQDKENFKKDIISKIPKPKDGITPDIKEVVELAVSELKAQPVHFKDIKGTEQLIAFLKTGGFRGGGSSGGGTTSPLTTKGDIWVYGTTNDRLPVGTDGYMLVADSTQPLGLKYAPAGTGTVGGSGTLNKIPLWTPNGTTLGNSAFTQGVSTMTLGITHDLAVNSGVIELSSGGVQLQNASGNLHLTGYLQQDSGGTGFTTYTTGDMLYASAANTLSKLGIGSAGQVLGISAGVPAWVAAGTGTVSNIATAGLISGGPITTTGTITTSMATNKLVGRGTAGTGIMEEITLGTNLSLSGTTLNAASPTGAALTKTDDTNVILILGGSPTTALLNATSITVGWTGTLADGRIASAATWNAKQAALSGTGIVKSTAGVISYLTDNSANWDTAYTNRITSLTTTGTSGAATLISNTLNIPQYQAAGTYVTSVGATSPITSSGGTTPTISTSMSTGKLIGRGTAGTGVFEEITLGTNLSLSGTTLNATGGGSSGPTLGQIHAYVMGVM